VIPLSTQAALFDVVRARDRCDSQHVLHLHASNLPALYGPSTPTPYRRLVRSGGKWRVRRKPARGLPAHEAMRRYEERQELGLGPDGSLPVART